MVNSNFREWNKLSNFVYGDIGTAHHNPITLLNFFDIIDNGSPTAIESGTMKEI